MTYFTDEFQFKGPHYARTFLSVLEIEQEIKDGYKDLKVPIFVSEAIYDSVIENEAIDAFYESIGTPVELKERKIYAGGDHYFIFDGWYSD